MISSSTHKSFIAALQKDSTQGKGRGHWLVSSHSSSQIQLTKVFGRTPVSVILERHLSGLYTIEPVTYAFKSTVSHFDYFTEEERRIRNKNVFKSLFQTLKRVKMWHGIENKESFIRVNTTNKKSNKDKVKRELSFFIE